MEREMAKEKKRERQCGFSVNWIDWNVTCTEYSITKYKRGNKKYRNRMNSSAIKNFKNNKRNTVTGSITTGTQMENPTTGARTATPIATGASI